MTKKRIYSSCGKLTGHYPVCEWLRVSCSYLKRICNGIDWNQPVSRTTEVLMNDLLERVNKDDPVKGVWNTPTSTSNKWKVWCDAGKIATGCVVECNGNTLEDGSWLRKEDDSSHINVAELESVIKGVNMILKSDVKKFDIMTDSQVVCG